MKDIIEKVSGVKVLVVGDIILDSYVWGDATRISPEAPVPVVEVGRESCVAGGAANVAFNVRALGAEVELCGCVGADKEGDMIAELCAEAGVEFKRELFQGETPTIQKTRVIVQHQQLCRLDREASPESYAQCSNKGAAALVDTAADFDVVILSDYAKGFLSNDTIRNMTDACHAAGKLIALDPKPRASLEFSNIDLLTPNRKEALQLAGIHLAKGEEFPAETVCKAIWDQFKPRYLVITLGEEGMLISEDGAVTDSIPTVAREVFDVSGAGDTIMAALASAMAGGAGLAEAARFANTAAGIVIGKIGTATVTPDEILAAAG